MYYAYAKANGMLVMELPLLLLPKRLLKRYLLFFCLFIWIIAKA